MLQLLQLVLLLNLASTATGERILPYSPLEYNPNNRLPPGLLANITLPANLWPNIRDALTSGEVGDSGDCIAKITSLLSAETQESVTFVDAAGKPPAGVTQGKLFWIGDYDMCVTMRDESSKYYDFCKMIFPVVFAEIYPATLMWSACLPQECRTGDLSKVYETIAQYINMVGFIKMDPSKASMTCPVKAEWDTGAYIAVCLLSFFAFFVIIGTLWYIIEPIVESLNRPRRGDKTLLVDAEETPYSTSNIQEKPEPKEEGRISTLLKCFALQRSFATLTNTDTKSGQVICLNGIRVLSINWVVLCHLYAFSSGFTTDSMYIAVLQKRRGFLTIANGYPSVDSFFTLSGFLVAYLLLKQLSKKGGLSAGQWSIFYIHRYIRLTVPYLVVILVEGFMYRLWIPEGPNVEALTAAYENCKKNWWTDLLYINNLNPWKMPVQLCVGQSWYLANDMQMFVVAPLFIAALFYKPLIGLCSALGAILGSVIATLALVDYYNLPPTITVRGFTSEYFWMIYDKPWIRITPYLVGILGGWFFWKKGNYLTQVVEKLPKWKRVVLATPIWLVTAAMEYAVVYGVYDDLQHPTDISTAKSMAYNSLSRIAWGLALTIQILACQCGLGGFINSLLSWRGWVMLGRLTYNVFLVHLGLFSVYTSLLRHTIPLRPDFEFAIFTLGFTMLSYLAAAVLYLLVEQPVSAVEALTIRKNRKS